MKYLLWLVVVTACDGAGDTTRNGDTAAPNDTQRVVAADKPWQLRRLEVAPARFRPGGWSDENTLWGLVGVNSMVVNGLGVAVPGTLVERFVERALSRRAA